MQTLPILDSPHPVIAGRPAREWVNAAPEPPTSPPLPSTPSLQLRILSYNILSESIRKQTPFLYRNMHDPSVQWRSRLALVLAEVEHYGADIVAMQEVQKGNGLIQEMGRRGYMHTFTGRTGGKPDGCALFWCGTRSCISERCNSATHVECPIGAEQCVLVLLAHAS